MEPGKFDRPSGPNEPPRQRPAGAGPLSVPPRPGTAPLGTPGAKPGAKPDAQPPADVKPAGPAARLARDGNATSQQGRQYAEQAANAYGALLQSADLQNRKLDDVFGKFQAKAGQEDATKKRMEKLAGEDQGEKAVSKADGQKELSATGRAFLRKDQKPLEEDQEAEPANPEEPFKDVFSEDENGTSERQNLDKLTQDQQDAYTQVASNLMGDPEARLGLQVLLLTGKLPGKALDVDDQDLLSNLQALATQELDPGIDRWKLVGDLVSDLANPAALSAESGPTDPVLVVLMMLAAKRPAEYVRLMRGLATRHGEVKLANGRTLKRKGRLNKGEGRWSARLLWEVLDDDDEEEEENDRARREHPTGRKQLPSL
jgi:hypothetical protein